MKKPFWLRWLLFIAVLGSAALECQELTVQTDARKHVLSRADIEALPRLKVTASDHSNTVNFEGASLNSVLKEAGITFGESLKGKRLASCLLVEASDGYRVLIALPELDPAFTDKPIVLVFQRDGKPLGEQEGPYRIVIPDEKRMAAGSGR